MPRISFHFTLLEAVVAIALSMAICLVFVSISQAGSIPGPQYQYPAGALPLAFGPQEDALARGRESFIPPPKYDHPTDMPVTVIQVDDPVELRTLCHSGHDLDVAYVGCSFPPYLNGNYHCVIYIAGPAIRGKAFHATYKFVLRHEVGHCNGWPADHPRD